MHIGSSAKASKLILPKFCCILFVLGKRGWIFEYVGIWPVPNGGVRGAKRLAVDICQSLLAQMPEEN